MLWELMERILHQNQSKEELFDWLWLKRQEFMTGTIDIKRLIIRKTVSKPLDSYVGEMMDDKGKVKKRKDGTVRTKSIPLHVKIAMKMKDKKQMVSVGDMIEYIVTKGKSPSEGVSIDEFKGEYDKQYYWEKQIWSEIERIVEVVYPALNKRCVIQFKKKNMTMKEEKDMTWKDFRFKRTKREGDFICVKV